MAAMYDFAPTARAPRGKGPRTKKQMRRRRAQAPDGQLATRRTRDDRRSDTLHVDERGRPNRR